MTKEEIVKAISEDKMMPFIQPDQLANIVDFVIKNYKPSLPSDLDEAAKDIVNDAIDTNDTTIVKYQKLLEYLVRAGAEWMAGQGETKDGEVLIDMRTGDLTVRVPVDDNKYQFKEKVIAQIRKK